MEKLINISHQLSIITIILLGSGITYSQTKLDSLYELYKDCQKVKSTYELEPFPSKSIYEVKCSISNQGLILMSLENHSLDTLELNNDCGLFHFFIEVNINDSITKYNTWCDHWEFRKYQLYPGNGITSCYGASSDDWIEKKIRVGIIANNEELFSEWEVVK